MNSLNSLFVRNDLVIRAEQAWSIEKLARQGSQSIALGQTRIVQDCSWLSRPAIIARVWNWLPVLYTADRDGDHWQDVEETLRRRAGDCEDWSILLAAVLKRLGIDARIGVMPGHAAVFVPIWNVPSLSMLLGQIDPQELIPANWQLINYGGHRWLALESTVPPEQRRLPGEHLDLIAPAVAERSLIIASP